MPFHVSISHSIGNSATVYNLSEESLNTRVVQPWLNRESGTFEGKDMDLGTATIRIYEGGAFETIDAMGKTWLEVLTTCANVTDSQLSGQRSPRSVPVKSRTPLEPPSPKRVMVVYGRDNAARNAMFGFLRDLGLEPVEWEQAVAATGRSTPTTKETIDAAFAVARTVVVLLTPDEEVRLHSDLAGGDGASVAMQPRPNVYIELGMAFALHPDRVVIVEIGGVRPASDLDGMNTIRLRGGAKELAALRSRLEIAGVQLSPSGSTDWLDGERFSRLEACSRVPVVDHRGELQNTRGGRSQPEAPGSADRAQVARVSAEVKYNGLENEIIFLITNHSDSAIYDVSWFHVTAENSWAASHQPFSLAPGESHTDTLPATVNRAIEAGRVAGFLLRDNAGVHWIKWGDAVVEQARNDLSQQISGRRN